MKGSELPEVRRIVLIISLIVTLTVCAALFFVRALTPLWVFFICTGALCIALHWWQLGSLIACLFGDGRLFPLRALLSLFPLAAALALVFVAGRLDRSLFVPAVIGLALVPVSAMGYALGRGFVGVCHE